MDEKEWELAVKLRGRSFQRNLDTYRLLTKLHTREKDNLSEGRSFNLAVMNVGAPAGGELIFEIIFHFCRYERRCTIVCSYGNLS